MKKLILLFIFSQTIFSQCMFQLGGNYGSPKIYTSEANYSFSLRKQFNNNNGLQLGYSTQTDSGMVRYNDGIISFYDGGLWKNILSGADTTSLSNRINLKLNTSDTTKIVAGSNVTVNYSNHTATISASGGGGSADSNFVSVTADTVFATNIIYKGYAGSGDYTGFHFGSGGSDWVASGSSNARISLAENDGYDVSLESSSNMIATFSNASGGSHVEMGDLANNANSTRVIIDDVSTYLSFGAYGGSRFLHIDATNSIVGDVDNYNGGAYLNIDYAAASATFTGVSEFNLPSVSLFNASGLPTSSAGIPSGDLWVDTAAGYAVKRKP